MSAISKLCVSSLNVNTGPDGRNAILNKAAQDYNAGKIESSIFYQVRMLYSAFQDRYFRGKEREAAYLSPYIRAHRPPNTDAMDNKLIKHGLESIACHTTMDSNQNSEDSNSPNYDFLQDITDSSQGFERIVDICKKFPTEWTITQVCKGPRPQTTYSTFDEIHKRDADIYLTLLRHARSFDYPEPICVCVSDALQVKLYKMFSQIVTDAKNYMEANSKDLITREAKAAYWENLKKLNRNIKDAIDELRKYFHPWLFLFRGTPYAGTVNSSSQNQKEVFAMIDELCNKLGFAKKERVLLSLAGLHATELSEREIKAISMNLSPQLTSQTAVMELLRQLQNSATQPAQKEGKPANVYMPNNYPCILIVDERLDHFLWEELNISQEMCRVNSLQLLWNLYNSYKSKIRGGYLCWKASNGAGLINPDNNLPKTEMRMRSFFNYWNPSWQITYAQKPTQDEFLRTYLKRDCYVYAGHGSGLQFVHGKHISKQRIETVVFLFGCDSTRMHSNGLYSDLVGPHIYYHAAQCPALLGCIIPALDAQMDGVAAEILSRWIQPDSMDIVTWQEIDQQMWVKQGIVEPIAGATKLKETSNYRISSLCGIICGVHARGSDKCYYNTVGYICRGLPVWNLDIQPLPMLGNH